jgi:uncharacterized membrane protein
MVDEPVSRLERVVGHVLHLGAASSTTLLAAGLFLSLVAPSLPLSGLLTSAGLIILMATPVARVVVSVMDYAAQRDWLFAALTSFVLVILLGSFLVALRG